MTVQSYVDAFQSFAADHGSKPAWLLPVRQAAIDRFRKHGFPTTHDEDWHFTSVAPIAGADFVPVAAGGGDVRAADLEAFSFGQTEWTQLVFVNGRYAPELSSPGTLPRGVEVRSLCGGISRGPAGAAGTSPFPLVRELRRMDAVSGLCGTPDMAGYTWRLACPPRRVAHTGLEPI